LSKAWNGEEGCDLHDLWLVMLESAKDRVLRVDTLGQQVLPCVQYGTAYLLITDTVGSVPCSDEWEIGVVTRLVSHGARGVMVLHTTPGILSIAMVLRTTFAKPSIRSIVNLCNGMW
jgi:hypothetical protein